MKKKYSKPTAESLKVLVETPMLNFTTETTDPKEGGDPTGGGNGTAPNPFNSFKPGNAKAFGFDKEEFQL